MDLEQQLRAALAPVAPRPQVRAVVLERISAAPGRRRLKPWLLTGLVVALAAAAALLVTRQPVRNARFALVDTVQESAPERESDTAVPLEEIAPSVKPPTAVVASAPAASAVKPFSVQLLPLKNDVADGAEKAAINATYAAVIEGLRTIPGLKLAVLGPDEVPAEQQRDRLGVVLGADFRISLEGQMPPSLADAGKYSLYMIAERAGPDGRLAGVIHTDGAGQLAPGCVTPAYSDWMSVDSTCPDPAGVAAGLLGTLSRAMFPLNPQLQQRLQARLSDQSLEPAVRLGALVDLSLLGRSSFGPGNEVSEALRDPGVVRAAIQLATSAREPEIRAQVWYMLRGSRDPALVQPLTVALSTDPDEDTRVQALETLAADFAADASARVALEAAAAREPHPMVRALAARALQGESKWTEYVLASLKDKARPSTDRLEALMHAYGLPSWRRYGAFAADNRILKSLDDAAMRALAEVLPEAAAESDRYTHSSLTMLGELARMEHPAMTDMFISLARSDDGSLPRSRVVETMRRRAAELRVREELERIAAEDPDPEVREIAARPLRPDEIGMGFGAASLPPRLGVMTDDVQAAPDIPDALRP